MNFISHYYFDGFDGRVYYNLGLILPDLMVIHKRSWRLNIKQNHLPAEPDPQNSIMQGCRQHILADSHFHNSDFFKGKCAEIKQILMRNNINSPPFRLFFISHILLELILDKIIIEKHRNIIDKFYSDLEKVDVRVIHSFLNNLTFRPTDGFAEFFQNFASNKYLYDYKDMHFIIHVLNRVLGRARVKQSGEEHYRMFLKSAFETEELLEISYLEAFSELNRLIKR